MLNIAVFRPSDSLGNATRFTDWHCVSSSYPKDHDLGTFFMANDVTTLVRCTSVHVFNHFPELKQSMAAEPLLPGVFEGFTLLFAYCTSAYFIVALAFIYLLLDRQLLTQILGASGVVLCVLPPVAWAVFNPAGAWVFLLPVIAPPLFASFVLYTNAKSRRHRRQNLTNLIPFSRSKAE